MNGNLLFSFIDRLIAHAPEVALWAAGVVLGLLLLLVFFEMVWGWRRKPASGTQDGITPEASDSPSGD